MIDPDREQLIPLKQCGPCFRPYLRRAPHYNTILRWVKGQSVPQRLETIRVGGRQLMTSVEAIARFIRATNTGDGRAVPRIEPKQLGPV